MAGGREGGKEGRSQQGNGGGRKQRKGEGGREGGRKGRGREGGTLSQRMVTNVNITAYLDVESPFESRSKEPSEGCNEGGKDGEWERVKLGRVHVECERAELGGRRVYMDIMSVDVMYMYIQLP